jgi:UDPglucose 6-dehydrogenase
VARFFVSGAGVEGTAGGRVLAEAGHVVTFVDPSPSRVAQLAAEGLDARSELVLAGEPESVVLLCSPTHDELAGGFDLSRLRASVVETGRALTAAEMRHIVVVRSSVPPGTTRHLVGPLLERISGRPEGLAFAVAAMPMFLRSAYPEEDARRPRLTMIGANSLPIAQRVRDLVVPNLPVKLYDDPATVELAKCVHSALHATRISMWNEVWQLCDRLGLEQDDVADAVTASPDPGPGYGTRGGAPYAGDRLPRDTRGLLGVGHQLGLDLPLLSAVVDVNTTFERFLEEELAGLATRS